MNHEKRLNRVHQKNSLIYAAILAVVFVVVFGIGSLLILVMSDGQEGSNPLTFIALLFILTGLVVFSLKNTIRAFYLKKIRTTGYSFDVRQTNMEDIITKILLKHNIPLSCGDEYVHAYFTPSANPDRHISHLVFESVTIPRISLTQEESSNIILEMSPNKGSWPFWPKRSIDFIVSLKFMSAHDRMKMMQDMSQSLDGDAPQTKV